MGGSVEKRKATRQESGVRQGVCTRFIAISWPDGNPTGTAAANAAAKKVSSYNYKETLLYFCATQHIFAAVDAKKFVTGM
jgi:hypothetical protein